MDIEGNIDSQKYRNPLIYQWLFYAVARAILRVLYERQLSQHSELFFDILTEIEQNKKANIVYKALDLSRQRILADIVAQILQVSGVITRAENSWMLSAAQLQTPRPQSLTNRYISMVYGEYKRWAHARPDEYRLDLSEALQMLPATPRRVSGIEKPDQALLPEMLKPEEERRDALQQVFFVTDRKQIDFGAFGNERSEDEPWVSYGSAIVSVPDIHLPADFERPWGFRGLKLSEDFNKHIVIQSGLFKVLGETEFFLQVTAEENSALIFVHGYSTSFRDCILRSGQIAHDMAFQGPVIAFSWPSRGVTEAYTQDITDALWAGDHLGKLLIDLATNGSRRVHILSHSVGGQVTTEAIRFVDHERALANVGELILAAPDIDQGIFRQRRKLICDTASRVTLYASELDKALTEFSKIVNGCVRAGDATQILVCQDVESIDATAVTVDWLGHGYFCETIELLDDIKLALAGTAPPRKNLMKKTATDGSVYWAFHLPTTP